MIKIVKTLSEEVVEVIDIGIRMIHHVKDNKTKRKDSRGENKR